MNVLTHCYPKTLINGMIDPIPTFRTPEARSLKKLRKKGSKFLAKN